MSIFARWRKHSNDENNKPYESNQLYILVDKKYKIFKNEAKKHKKLHRGTWWASALISLAMAFLSNFELPKLTWSNQILAALGILLPVITAYVVLRSPEKLWVFEISIRNRLSDLKDRIVLAYERNPQFDDTDFEKEYLEVLEEANKGWVEIKQ